MALFSKANPEDEARDAHGRWMQGLIDRGAKPYGTSGITGMSRDQVIGKVRGFLDKNLEHTVGPRSVTYTMALAAKVGSLVTSQILGLPADTQVEAEHHIASASGYISAKVLAHPATVRMVAKAAKGVARIIRKALDPDEEDELKGIVAGVIADTRLHPRISCDDAALSQVARGAYKHCHDRLCALKAS